MGSIGSRHARNILGLHHEVIAFDPFSSRTSAPESVQWADKPETAISESDAVVISTPHSSHLALMWECVKRDKSFLVEKPIASTIEGLPELQAEIDRRGIVTQVGYNLRFHPAVKATQRQIFSGALGEILTSKIEYGSYLPRWRPGKSHKDNYAASREDGGIILDDIHEIDIACHLFGLPGSVTCSAVNTGHLEIECEEAATIVLTGQPGCYSTTITMDYLQMIPTRTIKVVGTDGVLFADLIAGSVSVETTEEESSSIIDKFDANQMYVDEMRKFLRDVGMRSVDPDLDVAAGIETLKIALAARKSSLLRKEVSL